MIIRRAEKIDLEKIGQAIGASMLPTVIVQEGGYLSPELGINLVSFLEGFCLNNY